MKSPMFSKFVNRRTEPYRFDFLLNSFFPFCFFPFFFFPFLIFSSFFSPSVFAEYLSPEKAGFRQCALLYCSRESAAHDAETLKTLLVKYADGKPTAQPGYDAHLFLYFTVNGKRTEFGETVKSDWDEILAAYFDRGINVPALNQASAELRRDGFLKKDAKKLQVMFAVPWLNPKVTDFGDADGDGVGEDLSKREDRIKVLDWYITEIRKRMEAYPELELWGFYMMAEGIKKEDYPLARDFCRTIHEKGFRSLWIPYFMAPGVRDAYALGFDAVIMQSNWTFRTCCDGTGARRNRIFNSAEFSRTRGMGVELEMNPLADDSWRGIFTESLAAGSKTGFQQAAGATYFGSNFYWGNSRNPEERAVYSRWMDFIAGKPIDYPNQVSWTESRDGNGNVSIHCALNEASEFRLFDLFFHEPENAVFHGTILLDGRLNDAEPWKPLAWTFRVSPSEESSQIQNAVLSFPPTKVGEFRVRILPDEGSSIGSIVEARPDFNARKIKTSLAFGKSYVTSQETAVPTYPDETGRQLLDGVVFNPRYPWKEYVGWFHGDSANIFLNFPENFEFDEARVHFLEVPNASVAAPCSSEIVWSSAPGKLLSRGSGALPQNYGHCGDFVMNDARNQLCCRLPKSVNARSATISFQFSSWLFVSEVEFFLNGEKLSGDSISYELSRPTTRQDEIKIKYADDGRMLTDGIISTNFMKENVGVFNEPLTITVDLTRSVPIEKAACWLLDGGGAGIYFPQKGTLQTSEDGETWSEPLPFTLQERRKRSRHEAIPAEIVFPKRNARFVRMEFSGNGWIFASEIAVE